MRPKAGDVVHLDAKIVKRVARLRDPMRWVIATQPELNMFWNVEGGFYVGREIGKATLFRERKQAESVRRTLIGGAVKLRLVKVEMLHSWRPISSRPVRVAS